MAPRKTLPTWAAFVAVFGSALLTATAGALDTIGLTELLAEHPELTGSGQTVAQVEADTGGGKFEVSPSVVGLSSSVFSYYNTSNPYETGGTSFNSSLESGHADSVGTNYFGASAGVAPGVSHVENFEANYFINNIIGTSTDIDAKIINQSFVTTDTSSSTIATLNLYYDAYANTHGTLFVNAANNGTSTTAYAPGTMYNGITVGRTDGQHSAGVHLVAPSNATSFATPYVSGSAAILRQAAELGQFGTSSSSATDPRVLKAALLNGAVKTTGWSQTETNPLDDTYGAGIVNVKNSYDVLAGGLHARSSVQNITNGSTPTTATPTNLITATAGWDFATINKSMVNQQVAAHYFFDLSSSSSITLTATLTWNSVTNLTLGTETLRNLDLVLVNTVTDSIVWSSRSTTENVEYIYLTGLAGSVYDLQVIFRGGTGIMSETYALAWSWDSITAVPEPGTWTAVGFIGFLVVIAVRRRAA